VLLRSLERVIMVISWYLDSWQNTTEHESKKQDKSSKRVLCACQLIFEVMGNVMLLHFQTYKAICRNNCLICECCWFYSDKLSYRVNWIISPSNWDNFFLYI
jgi:hypothetical protein